ncbi:MAG: DUF1003 domain-containing protein [Patescibacteria group bacterium]
MQYKHSLPTLEEVREKRPILRNPVKETKLSLSPLERFALSITRHVGSMGFFILLSIWTVGWLLWNLLAPVEARFDPAPAFVIWLFMSNMIQLVLLPLVMVSQNIESKIADRRAQADFEVNKKSEREIEVIIAHLENQSELILDLSKKIDRS